MNFDDLVKKQGSWLDSGTEDGPVVSSRIRLARNISGACFPSWSSEEERLKIWDKAKEIFEGLPTRFSCWQMSALDPTDKEILFERHLISRELTTKADGCGVFVDQQESLAIMVNEEDHYRIQSLQSGLNLRAAWKVADELDDLLEEQLNYAFSSQLGYLTSCPSNVGTGMRASVMLHLPGLVLMEEMEPVINGISKIGLAVRGMWGEGTEAAGNMFQISNQITLGRREDEIIENLEQIVRELIEHENNARLRLMSERPLMVEDHVARAFGILSNARLISSSEALNLLSALRLGSDLKMIDQVSRLDIDTLFISTQPAHLQKTHQQMPEAEQRDCMRALILRDFMESISQNNSEDET